MSIRSVQVWLCAGALATIGLTSMPLGAQAPSAAPSKPYSAPRTPWGDPDLQGDYTNIYENGTPLERPDQFAGRNLEDIKGEELRAIKDAIRKRTVEAFNGPIHAPDNWWQPALALDKGSQAWLVVEPEDGRIPPLTPEARQRIAAAAAARKSSGRGEADSWTDRSLYDRCITRGLPGSMMPTIYGNSYQIVQGPGVVAIVYEMIHETRVIPIQGGPHVAGAIDLDMGDARGRWEGDTLVVETRNFKGRSVYRNANPDDAGADRALHAHQPGAGALARHGGRPADVDAAVVVPDAADAQRQRAAAALRVPRGQLRPEEHPQRGARRGTGRRRRGAEALVLVSRWPVPGTWPYGHGYIGGVKSIAAGKFKDVCLKTLDEVAATRASIVITKRGRPVAKLVPIVEPARKGGLAGSVLKKSATHMAPASRGMRMPTLLIRTPGSVAHRDRRLSKRAKSAIAALLRADLWISLISVWEVAEGREEAIVLDRPVEQWLDEASCATWACGSARRFWCRARMPQPHGDPADQILCDARQAPCCHEDAIDSLTFVRLQVAGFEPGGRACSRASTA